MSETKAGEAITVCVRLKPLSKEAGYPDVESIISLQPDGKTLCLATPSGWVSQFVSNSETNATPGSHKRSSQSGDRPVTPTSRRQSGIQENGRRTPISSRSTSRCTTPTIKNTPSTRRKILEAVGIDPEDDNMSDEDHTMFMDETTRLSQLPWMRTPTMRSTPKRLFKNCVDVMDISTSSPSSLPLTASDEEGEDTFITKATPTRSAASSPRKGLSSSRPTTPSRSRTPTKSSTPSRSTTPKRSRTPTRSHSPGRRDSASGTRADTTSRQYTFDAIFDEATEQDAVFEKVRPFVDAALDGYNATVFVYGATGSGKTHTMIGPDCTLRVGDDVHLESTAGIIPRAVDHIFTQIGQDTETNYKVDITIVELYKDKILDLLDSSNARDKKFTMAERQERAARKGIEIREDTKAKSVYLSGSETLNTEVASFDETMQLIRRALKIRRTCTTNCNNDSSRSHAVVTFTIQAQAKSNSYAPLRTAKINLVDLAGSERVDKSGVSGEAMKEATTINSSLTALSNVLSALSSSSHRGPVPYRNSKLTRLLQDSLGGNAKTFFVINVSSAAENHRDTAMSLQYGERAKKIKNQTKQNEQTFDLNSIALQEEIRKLEQLVQSQKEEIDSLREREVELLEGQDQAMNQQRIEMEKELMDVYTRGIMEKEEIEKDLLKMQKEKDEELLFLNFQIQKQQLEVAKEEKALYDLRLRLHYMEDKFLDANMQVEENAIELSAAKQTLKRKQSVLKNSNKQMQKTLATFKKKSDEAIDAKNAEIENFKKMVSASEMKLAAEVAKRESLVREIKEKEEELANEANAVASLREQANNAKKASSGDVAKYKEKISKLMASIQSLEESMKSLEAQNAQKQGKIDSLEKKLANIKEKAKAKILELVSRITELEEANEDGNTTIVGDETNISENEEVVEPEPVKKKARVTKKRESTPQMVPEEPEQEEVDNEIFLPPLHQTPETQSNEEPEPTTTPKKGKQTKSKSARTAAATRKTPLRKTPARKARAKKEELVQEEALEKPKRARKGRRMMYRDDEDEDDESYVEEEQPVVTNKRRKVGGRNSGRTARGKSAVEETPEDEPMESAPVVKPASKFSKPVAVPPKPKGFSTIAAAAGSGGIASVPSFSNLSSFGNVSSQRKLHRTNSFRPVDLSASASVASSGNSNTKAMERKRKLNEILKRNNQLKMNSSRAISSDENSALNV